MTPALSTPHPRLPRRPLVLLASGLAAAGLAPALPQPMAPTAAAALPMAGIGAVAPGPFNALMDFGMVLFVAAALALGAVIHTLGLGALAGGLLRDMLPLGWL